MSLGIALIIISVCFSLYAWQNLDFFDRYKLMIIHLKHKEYIRLLSAGFLHADGMHLFFNMFGLYAFHGVLEMIHPLFFLSVYFLSLLIGNLFAWYRHQHQNYYSAIGASGAVSGVIFATIIFVPNAGIIIFPIPFEIPAFIFGPLYLAYSIYGMRAQNDNIGHEAHLAGAITGALLALVWISVF